MGKILNCFISWQKNSMLQVRQSSRNVYLTLPTRKCSDVGGDLVMIQNFLLLSCRLIYLHHASVKKEGFIFGRK